MPLKLRAPAKAITSARKVLGVVGLHVFAQSVCSMYKLKKLWPSNKKQKLREEVSLGSTFGTGKNKDSACGQWDC